MLNITHLTVENLQNGCVTDSAAPRFGWALESDGQNVSQTSAIVEMNGWQTETDSQIAVPYGGNPLKPFTEYTAKVTACASNGDKAQAEVTFSTGRMDTPWQGTWITDGSYKFTEAKVSPVPLNFRREIQTQKPVAKAVLCATAMGIYEMTINGQKVGDDYFAPGFTSYASQLQYQTYDVTGMLTGRDTLQAVVAGGWAVGSFVFTRKNRVSADRQALLAELRITYTDGTTEVIGTDESWQVTRNGQVTMADLYDGETFDATVEMEKADWHPAAKETLRVHPNIMAGYGAMVKAQERLTPISTNTLPDGSIVYDFGQNFAGVIELELEGTAGQVVTVRHAEILNPDGSLNTAFLRTAKATATYTCKDGKQVYSPRLSYMGFRYACVSGVAQDKVKVAAIVLYSQLERTGDFSCSNPLLNRLQQNILWSSKSNLMDIPTDCPQRDERMGWTGDIAVFAPTACRNFDMSRFLEKWLLDVKSEQLPTGGIPNTVPVQGYGFPATMPKMAVAWWGDACVLVPWAEYQARGDIEILRKMYPVMKKYVKASKFWCSFGFGKHRYLWEMPGVLGFGDWVAPDVPQMGQWQARIKWTGTASLCSISAVTAKVAELLGEKEDAAYYRSLSEKTADAYVSLLTDGNGKLLQEFQTAYALPIYLEMFKGEAMDKAVENLVKLVEGTDYCIGTGFPGTPYILFALADHGRPDIAYKMLTNTKCPSWLYEVKVGATTIWEHWNGLDENGLCPIGDNGTDTMISYNHYASGAVGDFLYRRVAGLEPTQPGYKTFTVKPLVGGELTHAESWVQTPYGKAAAAWKLEGDRFTLVVTVPVSTTCTVVLPDGSKQVYGSGTYTAACKYTA